MSVQPVGAARMVERYVPGRQPLRPVTVTALPVSAAPPTAGLGCAACLVVVQQQITDQRWLLGRNSHAYTLVIHAAEGRARREFVSELERIRGDVEQHGCVGWCVHPPPPVSTEWFGPGPTGERP